VEDEDEDNGDDDDEDSGDEGDYAAFLAQVGGGVAVTP
jgi:hypothetical protein